MDGGLEQPPDLSRRRSMTTFSRAKQQLDADVEAFVKAGGEIEVIPGFQSAKDWSDSNAPMNRRTMQKKGFQLRHRNAD